MISTGIAVNVAIKTEPMMQLLEVEVAAPMLSR